MSFNKTVGAVGETEVIEKVNCPNCLNKLMLLPTGYPLNDIQCTACNFRAQVKSSRSKPKKEVLGAGWDIIDKVTKAGFLIPPLITNNKWLEGENIKQEVRFYPFIPKTHLKLRQLPPTAQRSNYKMFNYINLNLLPYIVLHKR